MVLPYINVSTRCKQSSKQCWPWINLNCPLCPIFGLIIVLSVKQIQISHQVLPVYMCVSGFSFKKKKKKKKKKKQARPAGFITLFYRNIL